MSESTDPQHNHVSSLSALDPLNEDPVEHRHREESQELRPKKNSKNKSSFSETLRQLEKTAHQLENKVNTLTRSEYEHEMLLDRLRFELSPS